MMLVIVGGSVVMVERAEQVEAAAVVGDDGVPFVAK